MKRLIVSTIALVVVVSSVWHFVGARAATTGSGYQFVEVTRGSLENVVSGTGTLGAVGTVEVGTQASGTIDRILVDYNDGVRKGQLLAALDTDLFAAAVRDAQAGVVRARAQYEQAEAEHNRNRSLFDKGHISDREFSASRTNREITQASYESAQAALDRAQTNLENAEFRSPIDGTVIQRNVEEGQTVAASLQAPILFVIAEDLAHMEILGLVDESDIGQIREGQEVRFTVQAYPDETFTGTVRQIRLQPQTVQNVVNYTVVIDAENERGLLLPGMTATVDFIVEKVEDVLLVPNAALRFQPSEEATADFQADQRWRMGALPDSTRRRMRVGLAEPRDVLGGRQDGAAKAPSNAGRLWYLDRENRLTMAVVRTGATDGLTTEIVAARDIQKGLRVISGMSSGDSPSRVATNQTTSQSKSFGMPGRPPGPPGLF